MRSRCVVYWMLAAAAVAVRQSRAAAAAYQYEAPNLQYQAYMPPPAAPKTTLPPVQPTSAAAPPEVVKTTLAPVAPTEPQPPQTLPPPPPVPPPTTLQSYKSLPEPEPSTGAAYLPPTRAPTQAAAPPEVPTVAKAAATLPPAPEIAYQAPPLSAEATSQKSAISEQPQVYMGVPAESKPAAAPSTLAPQPLVEQTSPHVEVVESAAPGQPAAPAGYGLPSMVNYGSIKKTAANGGDVLNYIVDKAGKSADGVGYGYGFPPSPRTSTSTTTTAPPPPPSTTVPTTVTPKPTTTVAPTTTTTAPTAQTVTTPPAPPPTPCSSSTQQEKTPCPFSGGTGTGTGTTPCPNSGGKTTAGAGPAEEPSTAKPCPSSQTGAKYGERQMIIRQPEEQRVGDKKVLAKDALCQDLFDKCAEWAADGECESNPFWMRPHCQRSCHSCGVTVADIDKPNVDGRPNDCKNHHELCQYWKRGNECESNKDYMTIHCPLSCGFC